MSKEKLQSNNRQSEGGGGEPVSKNAPIEEIPVEELTRRITDGRDLAIRIDATHELVRRLEKNESSVSESD